MASILCTGICKGCQGICTGCSKMCTGICTGCSKMCTGCCSCFAKCCEAPGKLVTKACKSGPFCIYVTVALLLNLPQIIMALSSLGNMPCQSTTWMIVNAVLSASNIAAAFYLAISIADSKKASLQHIPTAWSRASYLLCNDPWIAIYILVYIGFFAWSIVGSSWSIGGKASNGEKCEDSIVTQLRISIGLNFAFMFLGSTALCISLCCSCFDQRNLNQPSSDNQQSSTPLTQQKNDVETPLANAVPVYEAEVPPSAPPLDTMKK